jgi:hypothetical protein
MASQAEVDCTCAELNKTAEEQKRQPDLTWMTQLRPVLGLVVHKLQVRSPGRLQQQQQKHIISAMANPLSIHITHNAHCETARLPCTPAAYTHGLHSIKCVGQCQGPCRSIMAMQHCSTRTAAISRMCSLRLEWSSYVQTLYPIQDVHAA